MSGTGDRGFVWSQLASFVNKKLEPEYDSLLETSGKDCASGRGGGGQ